MVGTKLYFYGGAGARLQDDDTSMGRVTYNDWVVFDTGTLAGRLEDRMGVGSAGRWLYVANVEWLGI